MLRTLIAKELGGGRVKSVQTESDRFTVSEIFGVLTSFSVQLEARNLVNILSHLE